MFGEGRELKVIIQSNYLLTILKETDFSYECHMLQSKMANIQLLNISMAQDSKNLKDNQTKVRYSFFLILSQSLCNSRSFIPGTHRVALRRTPSFNKYLENPEYELQMQKNREFRINF